MADVSRLPGPFDHYWNWQMHASCRGLDSTLFFHPADERGEDHAQRVQRAKRICLGCPVRVQCLEHALKAREMYGVWGGLTERERRSLLSSRSTARRHARAS
ncbi:WhiB family transcriptional regulator [Streptomyces sp. NPDC002004]